MTVLNILATVSGFPKESLFSKIDFVMTDATSHNLQVETLLSVELQSSHSPKHLLCHVHPVFGFLRSMEAVFKDVEDAIGREKIFANFNVTPNESQESIMSQFLDCSIRLISHDFDHKPWNKADEFDLYIAPKSNTSVRMASERFTRYPFCCATVLHHDTEINGFLIKYDHVTNQLACIVRCFAGIEFLRIFALVGAVLGIHLIEPYTRLTSSAATTMADLQKAFPTLHQSLLSVEPSSFFQFDHPALPFVSQEIFEQGKYAPEIMKSIEDASSAFQHEVLCVCVCVCVCVSLSLFLSLIIHLIIDL